MHSPLSSLSVEANGRHDAPDVIQIVVGLDDGYACQMTVMLLSLFERNGAVQIHVHALVPTDFRSETLITNTLGVYANHVTFRRLDASVVANLKKWFERSRAIYYRLLIGSLLPESVKRVIYLDCDMLICGSISELWCQPLGTAIVAAVSDPGFTQHAVLGLEASAPYFNSGMLLIDLERWRAEQIGELAFQFAESNSERITFPDQCALNWVLKGRWLELPSQWNVQSSMLGRFRNGLFIYPRHLQSNARGARIIHFSGAGRPWHYLDEHPFKQQYQDFKSRTPWAGDPFPDRFPHFIAIKILRRWAPFLLPAYLQLRKYV